MFLPTLTDRPPPHLLPVWLDCWEGSPTFPSASHTYPHPGNGPALVFLSQLWLAWLAEGSEINLDLTPSLGLSWITGYERRDAVTPAGMAADTLSTIWWLG